MISQLCNFSLNIIDFIKVAAFTWDIAYLGETKITAKIDLFKTYNIFTGFHFHTSARF